MTTRNLRADELSIICPDARLVTKSGEPLNVGDRVVDFRGDERELTAIYPFSGMNGHVQLDNFGSNYPSVINAEFIYPGTTDTKENQS